VRFGPLLTLQDPPGADPAEPDRVFFPIALPGDSADNVAMGVAHTVAITGSGCETLSQVPLDLMVN
jgi:hypothetical protein